MFRKIILAGLVCGMPGLSVEAGTAYVGGGYAPQSLMRLEGQYNGIVDVSYFFWETEPTDRGLQWLCGSGYTYIFTDVSLNEEVHVFSVLPSMRQYLKTRGQFHPFLEVTIGPSYSSERFLGSREQGSHFIFNDFFSVGAAWGDEDQWEFKYSWRHLSNGNLYLPNPGWDVPFSFHLGRRF